MDPDDPYSGTVGGEAAPLGLGDAPPPAPPPPPPETAYAQAPAAAAQPTTNGLAGLFGLFGGSGGLGGGGVTTTAGTPGAAPSINQSMVGLGLGMLSGNPFNKWGAAMRGYQTGAAADLARQQQVNQYGYQQQELALRRAQMAQTAELQRQQMQLSRDIAFKPQVQFHLNEDTGDWDAFQYDPVKQTMRKMPIAAADKMAAQEGVDTTAVVAGQTLQCPAGVNCREWRKDMARANAQYEADRAAGKIGPMQTFNQWFSNWMASRGMTSGPGTTAATPPTPSTGGAQAAQRPQPTQRAIIRLRRDPNLKQQFDEYYGEGAADKYLKGYLKGQ